MSCSGKVILTFFVCTLPTLLSASSWFNFFSDVEENQSIGEEMVSPIVNREVEASVIAHDWPFVVDNVYCEAWSYHRHQNWDFMDRLVKLLSDGEVDKGSVEAATELVLKSTEKKDGALLQYSLSLRAQSPLCELHRTLARSHMLSHPTKLSTTEAFFVSLGKQDFIGATLTDLSTLIALSNDHDGQREEEMLLPDEVVRNTDTNQNDSPLIILYANMGSDVFVQLYQALVEKQLRFVVRHRGNIFFEENGGMTTALQGYGVRLDVRNVEYRVFDDRSTSVDGNEASLLNTSSLEHLTNHTLAGINLSQLKISGEEKFKLQSELWKLHEAQQIHSQLIPPKWQRRKLSLQAATVISESQTDVLLTLQDVSQNLPSVASTLVHVPVTEELVALVDSMEPILRQTNGVALTINGRRVPIGRPSFNVFDLLDMMREEQELLDGMWSKLNPFLSRKGIQQVQKVWTLGEGHFLGTGGHDDENDDYAADNEEQELSGTVRRIDVGRKWKGAVLYVNDVEKDEMYMTWPRSVQQAVMSMQFGAPPTVRRNLFTILCVLDPLEENALHHAGLGLGSQLMQASYPVRVGHLIVNGQDIKKCKAWIRDNGITDPDLPCPTDPVFDAKVTNNDQLLKIPASTHAIHRLIAKVNEEYSGQPLLPSFTDYFFQRLNMYTVDGGSLTMGDMVRTFGEIMQQLDGMSSNSATKFAFDALNGLDSIKGATYGKALRFSLNRAITPGMGFLNGRPLSMENDPGKMFMEEQNFIFGLIMKGKITDSKPKSIYGSILTGDGVFPRLHPLLNDSDDEHLDLNHGLLSDSLLMPKNFVIEDAPDAVFVVEAVVNMKSKDDIDFIANFLNIMDAFPNKLQDGASTANVLIGYRIVCAPSDSTPALCSILSNAGILDVERIKIILSQEGILEKSIDDIITSVADIDGTIREKLSSFNFAKSWTRGNRVPPANFVCVNGKSYAPEEGALSKDDIELLLSMEISRSKATTKMLSNHLSFDTSNKKYFEAISKASIFLARQFSKSEKGKGKRMDMVNEVIELEKEEKLDNNPLRFSWNMDDSEELKMQVSVALDPATEDAQRVAPFLLAFRDVLKFPLQMVLLPTPLTGDDKSVPITSYYRFVADPNAMPDRNPPKASFSNLPTNHILTLRMDVPESWNVQQTRSIQDTDNLRCEIQMGCSDDTQHDGTADQTILPQDRRQITRVEYGLKNLLIFGQCYDATRKSPPNGLQLALSKEKEKSRTESQAAAEISPDGTLQVSYRPSEEDTYYSDTLVMKTVGYWQLRANPGIWQLNIAPESRGAEIFDMVDGNIENGQIKLSKKQVNNATKTIYVKDFTANEDTRVLIVKRRPGWEKASLFYEDKKVAKSSDDDVIHVFSLATGHLYERFLKIMMLSVTKRTSMKVKFWLFENFLSPTFKASAESMAKRIGCEVDFVTYKWPEFLRGQSEKQRIIWGYKILFLDVLFPLNVKKIIYVDADQVVRGDLKELWEMDLKGAPYGYTPMCSSRESTLGFQFWRGGFWESHLRGKPYHISALYVVDLEKFRKDLVGDTLRSTYQQLSADPNSLANLDQDLPNYAQHQVPIFSLPQEWLWCESWCSDESKAAAKTIDLCNNPLHKEPKVSMAKRVISGDLFEESWIELDAEVEAYEKEYLDLQSMQ
mmetsp:Transcript_4454/g.6909  ORF Transcript_4454/g.6909 Transcript_4454/m.6909 type:complete len:1653 (+) Transcript_4454:54-5012(+)|eukprot:CAMPEP_0178935808 /NCGR_PEP_ID=MMETSP0786-20121207/24764_1 /TAXON_ID=186022 /ORGANISM="Thalassionema frauenfeldii, Strain CCMP 1798" /LENGTH=1652 /DNA_ID=CAMNT_0020614023 /DNA_START=45 /DNA_END=5003 /DNA_ORIENTATION=+